MFGPHLDVDNKSITQFTKFKNYLYLGRESKHESDRRVYSSRYLYQPQGLLK